MSPTVSIAGHSQQWWSWGAGTDGQLGTEKQDDEYLPQLVPFSLSSPTSLSFLACGGAHVVALTSDGKALSWGRGTSGQLGHGNTSNTLYPKLITFLNQHFITNASTGWDFSGFVSDAGELFVCGNGTFGQLGLGDYTSHSSPMKHPSFSKTLIQISCGMRHSLILLRGSYDEVYSFGYGNRGQLGPSSNNSKSNPFPTLVAGLPSSSIVSVTANGDHSAAIYANGNVFLWGRSFTTSTFTASPSPVNLPSSAKICHVALGWNHALLLTDEGEVFMIGKHKGVTSGDEGVRKVVNLKGIRVAQVAAGAEHSLVVTEDGDLMSWGWGEHGQLGLGDHNDQFDPQTISLPSHFLDHSLIVSCGSGFSFAIKTSFKV